jgi:phosphomannomutase
MTDVTSCLGPIDHIPDKLAMVASTVSSKMIEAMAHSEGFKFVDCLTGKPFLLCLVQSYRVLLSGFKFIGNTALELERAGYEVPFGYEEAIGFMFGSEIRDKDGIAATVSNHLLYLHCGLWQGVS